MSYKRIVLDIEANNLLEPMLDFTQRPLKLKESSKLWCINIRSLETNESITFIPPDILEDVENGLYEDSEYDEAYDALNKASLIKPTFNRLFSQVDEIVGHNIIKYDLPVLKLFGILDYEIGYPFYDKLNNIFKIQTTINGKEVVITDTLIWSKLLNPDRFGGHSLKAFGKQGLDEKLNFENFDTFSKEMMVYCDRDTLVNLQAYESLMAEKDDYEGWEHPYLLEAKLADLVLKQELFGFYYDKELSEANKIELDRLLQERYDRVTPNIPPKPLNKGETKKWTPPAKAKTKAGTLTSHMKKFLEKIGSEYNPLNDTYVFEGREYSIDNTECVKESLPADITDLAHLKWYLTELGWVPSQWNIRDLSRDSKKKVLDEEKFIATVDRYVTETMASPFKDFRLNELELSLDTTAEELKEFILAQRKPGKTVPIRVPTTPPLKVGATKEICENLQKLADDGTVPFVSDIVEYYTYQHRRNSIAGGIDEDTGEPSKGFESYVRADGRISTPVDSNATSTSRMAHKVVKITSLLLKQL